MATPDQITITIDVDVLDDLRTAALERFYEEQSAARRLGAKGLKRMAARAGGNRSKYLNAIQVLDQVLSSGDPS